MRYDTSERIFLAVVRRCAAVIGYGRMMQIISHEWWRRDPIGALTVGTCYALLPADDRTANEEIARADKIFQEAIND